MKPALKLFGQIMALKGFRQVTVATSSLGARTYDVSEQGVVGYAPAHRDLLLEHLQEAIENVGGIVVRQFRAEKQFVMMPAGIRLVPVKHVFGALAGRGRWRGLSSEEMRTADATDFETGKALEPAKATRFLDWRDGLEVGSMRE